MQYANNSKFSNSRKFYRLCLSDGRSLCVSLSRSLERKENNLTATFYPFLDSPVALDEIRDMKLELRKKTNIPRMSSRLRSTRQAMERKLYIIKLSKTETELVIE